MIDKKMNVSIEWFPHGGYTVYVNGEVVLECLAEDEVHEITLGDLVEMNEKLKETLTI